MSFQSGGFVKLPRFGFSLFPRICNAVDFPIPFIPTKPKIWPGLGVGNLCNLKAFFPYLCVHSLSIFLGTLIILMALNGHFFTHIPQPIHRISEISEMVEVGITSMHIFSVLFTGQAFLHSCLHFLGLHFYLLTIAILCFESSMKANVENYINWTQYID